MYILLINSCAKFMQKSARIAKISTVTGGERLLFHVKLVYLIFINIRSITVLNRMTSVFLALSLKVTWTILQ